MFRLLILALMLAAVACSSEKGSDVGVAGKSAAEVSGQALVSAVDVAPDSASEPATDVASKVPLAVYEAPNGDVAPAPDAEAAAVGANDASAAEKRLTD